MFEASLLRRAGTEERLRAGERVAYAQEQEQEQEQPPVSRLLVEVAERDSGASTQGASDETSSS